MHDHSTVDREKLLVACPLFAGLDTTAIADFSASSALHRIAGQAFLFMEDQPATMFCILAEGRVRLSKLSESGQQVVVRIARPADAIGIIAAIPHAVYPLSAQAILPSIALVWDQATLKELLARHPLLAARALNVIAERFIELQDQYLERATERVERRIANTLLRLANQLGRRVEQGILLDLPLSRQDIAEMSGTTLYTASRTLSRWEQQGIVVSIREQVIISAPHQLVAIANDSAFSAE